MAAAYQGKVGGVTGRDRGRRGGTKGGGQEGGAGGGEGGLVGERGLNLELYISLCLSASFFQTLATAMAAAYQGQVGSVGQRRSLGKGAAAAGLVLLLLVVSVV